MARPTLLSQEIISDYLKLHPLWAQPDNESAIIVREIGTASFAAAVGIINAIALIAEKADHHPFWTNVYNKVEIKLSTHDAGDIITEKDRKLAAAIDKLV